MKVTIESTDKIVELLHEGQAMPARIWEGVTERGVPCHLYVTRVAVGLDADASEFERDLEEKHKAVSAEVAAVPARLII